MDKLAAIMKELNSKYTITTERLAGVQTEDGYTPNLYYDLGNYVDSLKPNASMKDQFATQLKATVKAAQSTASSMAIFPRSCMGAAFSTCFKKSFSKWNCS